PAGYGPKDPGFGAEIYGAHRDLPQSLGLVLGKILEFLAPSWCGHPRVLTGYFPLSHAIRDGLLEQGEPIVGWLRVCRIQWCVTIDPLCQTAATAWFQTYSSPQR